MFENGAVRSPEVSRAPVSDRVLALQTRIRDMESLRLPTRLLPTLDPLARLLPGGGVKQGVSYSVADSSLLAMGLLAGVSAAGGWCAAVGLPDAGVEAAQALGVDLERLVLVPRPGEQWMSVTAALLDVLPIVLLRSPGRVGDSAASRLAGRLRARGATLVVLGDWPASEASLRVEEARWTGLGSGHGHLRGRLVTVRVSPRLDRPRTARLWLPDDQGRLASVEQGR